MAKRQQRGADTKLAPAYFRAVEEANRLSDMIKEKVVDLVGGITEDNVDFLPFDDGVEVILAPNSLRVEPNSQQALYGMGFKRIFLYHQNGFETYYYVGGDLKGYTKLREI